MTQRPKVSPPKVPFGEHIEINPSVYYVGTPVALLTSLNPDGSANISPMSSVWALFDRFVLGLTSTSMGRENVARECELVLNFPSAELWPQVEAMARSTGRHPVPRHRADLGYRFDRDKFAIGGLTPQPSVQVKPPRIAECPLQFEAVVVARHGPGGDWSAARPEAFEIVEAKVVCVHARPDIVLEGTNHVDTAAWRPLLYMFRHYFGIGQDLGRTFKAEA